MNPVKFLILSSRRHCRYISCFILFVDVSALHVAHFLFCSFQIDDIEVESWVVKAITAKLLDCKIDQMNQVVIVRCAFCSQPSFLFCQRENS